MNSQKGAAAVVAAVSISLLVMLLAFAVNVGYFYDDKSRLQNAVDAAAMAAAAALATVDADSVARSVAEENGVPRDAASDPEQFVITFGTYEEADGIFTAGASGEENAVRIELKSLKRQPLLPWIGSDDQGGISVSAMAYLVRWGMVSLADSSDAIRLQGGVLRNGDIFAAGDIKYTGPPWSPSFENVRLFARGSLLQCPVTQDYSGYHPHWDSGAAVSIAGGHPATTRTVRIQPVTDNYFQSLKATADVVYTPDQAGQDGVFFGKSTDGTIYYFDLSGARAKRQTILFDGPSSSGTVRIAPKEDAGSAGGVGYPFPAHEPLGNTVENVTFITNLAVNVADGSSWSKNHEHHIGAPGERQAIVITTKGMGFSPGYFRVDGITFRCGGDFVLQPSLDLPIATRIIADGTITATFGRTQKQPLDFTFAAPAPPAIVRLVKTRP